MKAPARISGTRVGETTIAPATPIASAPPRPPAERSDQRAPREPGAERPAVQLVHRVGADPDGEEEGGDRRHQPAGVDMGRHRRPDRHVADVPERVGRVQNGDQVAPAARLMA